MLINIVRVASSSILVQREKVTILLTKSNFNGDTTLPENMAKTFLTDETNKTKLNQMIAEMCKNSSVWTWDKQFCITNNLTDVLTEDGRKSIYIPDMIQVLEEADNIIVCHPRTQPHTLVKLRFQ